MKFLFAGTVGSENPTRAALTFVQAKAAQEAGHEVKTPLSPLAVTRYWCLPPCDMAVRTPCAGMGGMRPVVPWPVACICIAFELGLTHRHGSCCCYSKTETQLPLPHATREAIGRA